MRRIQRIMRILKKIMEKKGRQIGGTAPPIFINLPLLFMFSCLFFCLFFCLFLNVFFFNFLCFVWMLWRGFWGWVRPGFFPWPFYVFFFYFYFLGMLTYFWGGCYDERLSGMVEKGNFFFCFFPLVFSLKDDRLDIYHYYCNFAYVGIAEIEILSESEVTDKKK